VKRGRALGRGRLDLVEKAKGKRVYVGHWHDANGKRHRKQLGSDRGVAGRQLADIIRQRDLALAGLAQEEFQEESLETILARFVDDLESRCTPLHIERTKGAIEKVLEAVKAPRIRALTPARVLEYQQARKRQGVANATVNKEVGSVKSMLNFAVRAGLLPFNPLQAIAPLPQGPAHQKLSRRALKDEEIEKLLAVARADDRREGDRRAALRTIHGGTKGRRFEERERKPRIPQYPLWLALLETGARWKELTSTTWADADLEASTLRISAATAKTRRERVLPLSADVVRELRAVRLVHHEVLGRIPMAREAIFLTPTGSSWVDNRKNALAALRDLLEDAEIPEKNEHGKIDIHALRHTAASRLARHGVPQHMTAKLLGHQDPKLTAQYYTHLEVEDLRSSLSSLPALASEPSSESDIERDLAVGESAAEGIPGAKLATDAEGAEESAWAPAVTPEEHDVWSGARGENRTRNPCFTKAVLYR